MSSKKKPKYAPEQTEENIDPAWLEAFQKANAGFPLIQPLVYDAEEQSSSQNPLNIPCAESEDDGEMSEEIEALRKRLEESQNGSDSKNGGRT